VLYGTTEWKGKTGFSSCSIIPRCHLFQQYDKKTGSGKTQAITLHSLPCRLVQIIVLWKAWFYWLKQHAEKAAAQSPLQVKSRNRPRQSAPPEPIVTAVS
jgi:hypothetical protein